MDKATRAFHSLYYSDPERTWQSTRWMGIPAYKCPMDMWIYQEIIFETRPDVIIECGTHTGGSALFMANICDLVGKGRVLTVDIASYLGQPIHPRIEYLHGSSVEPSVVELIKSKVPPSKRTMVVLDSEHSMTHVLAEMRSYAPLVTPGCYMIVEDTNVNGNPVLPKHGPGPAEAVRAFLAEDKVFVVDQTREKLLMTFNPGGYLKRIG